MKKLLESHHPYAAVTILCWSLAYVFTRLTVGYFSASSLGFLRNFIASCVLLAVAVFTRMKLPRRKEVPWYLISGAVGIFFYIIAFNQGQATVSAATASVVIATAPVITALLARVFYREKLFPRQWAAVALELLGVTVLTLLNDVFSLNSGLLWLFLAALALSSYNLLQRRLTKSSSSLQATTYSIFVGTALFSVFAHEAFRELAAAPPAQYACLAVLGLGSSALGYLSWAKAFSKAQKTSQVSNYMFLTPLVTSVLGFLIAGEVPDRATVLGGGIILLGMLVFQFGGKPRPGKAADGEDPNPPENS